MSLSLTNGTMNEGNNNNNNNNNNKKGIQNATDQIV